MKHHIVTEKDILAARDRRLRRDRARLFGLRLKIAKALDTTATLNPILSAIANQFMRDPSGFVGIRLMPAFPTAVQSGQYYMFTAAELAQVPTLNARAPGTPYPRLKQTLSKDDFACRDYGIEAPVPDEDRKKYATFFDADQSAMRRLVDTMRVNHEQRVYNLTTTGGTPSAAVGIPWNDGASSPKTDVDAARESVRLNIGLKPNLLVLTRPMVDVLSIHPKLQDVFKYTGGGGVLEEDRIAAYFQVAEVAIAESVIATNNEGQVFTPADIWGNNAVVAHVNDTPDLSAPNFGRTFYWIAFTSEVNTNTGGTGPAATMGGGGPDLLQITSYRDETVKSDIHRSEHYVGEKLTAVNGGFVLQNPLH